MTLLHTGNVRHVRDNDKQAVGKVSSKRQHRAGDGSIRTRHPCRCHVEASEGRGSPRQENQDLCPWLSSGLPSMPPTSSRKKTLKQVAPGLAKAREALDTVTKVVFTVVPVFGQRA